MINQRVYIGGTRDLVHYVRFSFNRQPKAHVFPRVRVRLRLTVKRGIFATALELSSPCGNRTLPLQREKLAASPEAQRAKLFCLSVVQVKWVVKESNLPPPPHKLKASGLQPDVRITTLLVNLSSVGGSRTHRHERLKFAALPVCIPRHFFRSGGFQPPCSLSLGGWKPPLPLSSTQDRSRTCILPGLSRTALPLAHLSIVKYLVPSTEY